MLYPNWYHFPRGDHLPIYLEHCLVACRRWRCLSAAARSSSAAWPRRGWPWPRSGRGRRTRAAEAGVALEVGTEVGVEAALEVVGGGWIFSEVEARNAQELLSVKWGKANLTLFFSSFWKTGGVYWIIVSEIWKCDYCMYWQISVTT